MNMLLSISSNLDLILYPCYQCSAADAAPMVSDCKSLLCVLPAVLLLPPALDISIE
jgi:hypothetical protein